MWNRLLLFQLHSTNKIQKAPNSSQIRCLFFLKYNYIAHFAVQRITKGIKGFGAYSFAFLNSVQSICRKALLENQVIFGNPLF